jgi:4-diphosphocytidyl-2-C-methyl-D-erythritol kinase
LSASPVSTPVVEAAPSKINLYLHVLGRRADGFHRLDSLVAFTELGDRLRAAPATELTLSIDGPFAAALPDAADNLVMKAARALLAPGEARSAALTLTKNLPVASGIGGGSADAAATLRALERLWDREPGDAELLEIARRLGSDVPVCLASRPAFIADAGETVTPAPRLPRLYLVLANPGIELPTARVFAARSGPFLPSTRPAAIPDTAAGFAALLGTCRNDLTDAAIGLVPAIREVLQALTASPGCRLSRMSGSGATCFGLYDDLRTAEAAAVWLRGRQRGWWIEPTRLAS